MRGEQKESVFLFSAVIFTGKFRIRIELFTGDTSKGNH